jgi:HD-like signal output (HDOD) protein
MTLAVQKNVALPDNFTIPTMPAVVQRIAQLVEDPDVGLREIAAVVSEDAPLAAKVLKIANSTYYGLRERCISTQQAAAVLGVRVLRNVVTQASVIKQYEHLDKQGIDLDQLWRHSIVMAQGCAFVVRRCKKPLELKPDEAYVCGLLHDLRQVVLFDNLGAKYAEVVRRASAENLPISMVEHQSFGFDHSDVGHKIATRWGLPQTVVRAVAYHHGPASEIDADPITALIAKTNLHVNAVAHKNLIAATAAFDAPTTTRLGLTATDIADLSTFVEEALRTVEV